MSCRANARNKQEAKAMVHIPITLQEAMRTPAAKASLDKEWKKLNDKQAWKYDTVREKQAVVEEAKRLNLEIHLGRLMALCHEKHRKTIKKVS